MIRIFQISQSLEADAGFEKKTMNDRFLTNVCHYLLEHITQHFKDAYPECDGPLAHHACQTETSNVHLILILILFAGNHEYVVMDVDNWLAHLEALGFTILHNSHVHIEDPRSPGEYFCLAGVDDWDATKLMP